MVTGDKLCYFCCWEGEEKRKEFLCGVRLGRNEHGLWILDRGGEVFGKLVRVCGGYVGVRSGGVDVRVSAYGGAS